MDGNVCLFSHECIRSTHMPIDFILAWVDFEAGFMYVKVMNVFRSLWIQGTNDIQAFGYTDLMSCMLLDA